MKDSISYLPPRKQTNLRNLVNAVLSEIPYTQMIILYGSYARNNYVDYDERIEFGIHTSYASDYDILVVTSGISNDIVEDKLDEIEDKYSSGSDRKTPVQFINEDIKELNQALMEARYFYTQLKREGVMLYNNGHHKLAAIRKLNYDEIKQQAEKYYEEKYDYANDFFRSAMHSYADEKYRLGAFLLHQACENLFFAVRLVFTLQNKKQHNLAKLLNLVKSYSENFIQVFPRKTVEEKRLFKLLKAAYIEARYNPQFVVNKEDFEALIPIIELFFEIVKQICDVQIQEYNKMATKPPKATPDK